MNFVGRPVFVMLFAVVVSFWATPAFAGFEWLPPSQNPTVVERRPQPPQIIEQYAVPVPMMAPTVPMASLPQKSGLVIDPYPLRSGAINPTSEVRVIEQAMIEEARVLNPVALGGGAKTSTQARAIVPMMVEEPSSFAPLPPKIQGGITPMMGGEPPPLPGAIPQPYLPPQNAIPIRSYQDAVGFGRDLPLAIALSQVVPSEFVHSYAPNVDTGTTVSWEGGEPWNVVLNKMLKPRNLGATIQGNQVIIRPI